MPIVSVLLEKEHFFRLSNSQTVQQLKSMGMQNLAAKAAYTTQPFAGRLQHFQVNWNCITQDPWVLQTIQGFQIQFMYPPWQTNQPKELTFSKTETEALQKEITAMQSKQTITKEESRKKGFFSQMFLVPKKDGGQRPVVNLKRLNSFVKTEHFKMEGIHMLKDLLRPGDWMAKVDLKDAYFMIPIAREDREFLKFKWQEQTFQFNCLPFGLSSAPWVFTKTTRPIAAALRELGLRLIIYIDDILIMAESPELLKDQIMGMVFLLENLGFVVNHTKSQFEPTQEIEFLGFTINSCTMELKLPGEKIKKIKSEARKILACNHVTALMLSRLLGKMTAATQAIKMAPLFTRNLQSCLREALKISQDYMSTVHLTPEAVAELHRWEEHFTNWNG